MSGVAALSRKRKEPAKPTAPEPAKPTASEPASNNRLLAGYMAHEFLKQGTLFGQRFGLVQSPNEAQMEPVRAYADVAMLLKTDGAHISGVLNPTHLAHWLQTPPARDPRGVR